MTSRLSVAGTVRVPGDKSISHRSLLLAALGHGSSRVRDILQSADVHSSAGVLRAMGVPVPELSHDFVIKGHGPQALVQPTVDLDCGNSGTTTRLVAGIVAGRERMAARFVGDMSLSRRPMKRIAAPLVAMGARVESERNDGLPMLIVGARLRGIDWRSEHASAQVKGAILLAGVSSGASVTVHEPSRSRDHSERMLRARGAQVDVRDNTVTLHGNTSLHAIDVDVPGDPSSAAFFVALAGLAHDGELQLPNVCLNPTRTGGFDILARMGVSITMQDERDAGGEPLGTLVVRPGTLRATSVRGAEIPRAIDELPLIACVAARAVGETRISGAAELRVKESDRITAVVRNLRLIGVDAEELPDGMIIRGSDAPLRGHVITHGDHRLAMAFGILAAIPGNAITIDDPACVSVSFPDFWTELARVIGAPPPRLVESGTATPPSTTNPRDPDVATHAAAHSATANHDSSGSSAPRANHDSSGSSAPGASHENSASLAPNRLIIAIDGPAASGKSSTSQWVAKRLGVRHVDSGAFYRALTAANLRTGRTPDQWTPESVLGEAHRIALALTDRSVVPTLDGETPDEELRGRTVTQEVYRVASMPAVREWVNARVREAGASSDVVVDGRDIGTVVFPQAPLKVFLIADPWERARRRLVQRLERRPTDAEIALETEALVARDAKDATQSRPDPLAITIDTTTLTQEEQVDRIVALAEAARDGL